MPVGMTVAELVARLRADTSDFSRGLNRAQRDLGNLDGQVSRGMASLGKLNQGFNTMAATISLGAATAVSSLAAIGVSYNTLMQKTTAAFTVLLGSAKKSNEMVQELTDFARKSPFPRQIFIEGAQQLIGFGLAARKVVPAFQAIEDAVAAVGGGSEQISEFTQIFARIKSLGHANAEELMRFSIVGIDAFKLLADSAGTSVDAMRKRISSGLMGADETIDLLTKGLEGKFAGSANLVKKTWIGAVDRIKGAWRDIGSALMAPFIDPHGGGAAVEWANQLADLLRQRVLPAVTDVADHMGRFVDRIVEVTSRVDFKDWMQTAVTLWHEYGDTLKTLLPMLGAVTVGFAKQGLAMVPLVGNFANFLPMPGKLVLALVGLLASTKEGRQAFETMGTAIRDGVGSILPRLLPMIGDLAQSVADLLPPLVDIGVAVLDTGLPLMATGLQIVMLAAQAFLGVLQPMTEFLAKHPAIVRAVAIAYSTWKIAELTNDLGDWVRGIAVATTALLKDAASAEAAAVASNSLAASQMRVNAAMASGVVPLAAVEGEMAALAATNSAASVSSLFTVGRFAGLQTAAASLAPMLSKVTTFMTGLGGAAVVGLGTGLLAATSIMNGAAKAAKNFKEEATSAFTFDSSTQDLDDWAHSINRVGSEYENLRHQGNGNVFKQFGQNLSPFNKNSIQESGEAAAAVEKDLFATKRAYEDAMYAVTRYGEEAGLTTQQVEYLARRNKVDLTQGSEKVIGALRGAWEQTKANGQENQFLADSFDMTLASYERYAAYMLDHNGILRGSADALARGNQVAADMTIEAFQASGEALMGLSEAYAPTIEKLNADIQGFLSPIKTWGEATAQVQEKIQADHSVFVDNLRNKFEGLMDAWHEQYDRLDSEGKPAFDKWVATVKGSTTDFDTWAADINGFTMESFTAQMDTGAQSFDQFIEDMFRKQVDLQNWSKNLATIGEKGGADLALEISKWGPEMAPMIAELANAGPKDFEAAKALILGNLQQTADGMIEKFGLMKTIADAGGADTVAGIESSLGLLPGSVQAIAEKTAGDFGFVMAAMAAAAETSGADTASGLAGKLAEQLDMNYSTVSNSLKPYMDLFTQYGIIINGVGDALSRSFIHTFGPDGKPIGSANGNILRGFARGGILKAFAGGGVENHVAGFARGTRIWAEPETGGEAYIPLSPMKRGRSMGILAQVADMFGERLVPKSASPYADGGVTPTTTSPNGRGSVNYNLTVNQAHGESTEQSLHRTLREIEYLNS